MFSNELLELKNEFLAALCMSGITKKVKVCTGFYPPPDSGITPHFLGGVIR